MRGGTVGGSRRVGISFETGVSYSPMGGVPASARLFETETTRFETSRFSLRRPSNTCGERRTRVVSALVTFAVPRRVRHRHGRVRERWSVRVREVSARSVPGRVPNREPKRRGARSPRKLKRFEARDDAAHRLHVALSAALVAVDHDQVRVRTRACTARRERSRRCARGRTGESRRAPRRQHPEKKSRRFFSAGTVSAPGAGRALVVVTRDRGEARVQAEQARLRGGTKTRWRARRRKTRARPRRGFEDASCDERGGFKREERGGVWWGSEELDGGARLRAEASRDVAVATENRVGDALGAQHVERGHGRGVAGVRSGVVALPRFTTGRFFGRKKSLKKKKKRYV